MQSIRKSSPFSSKRFSRIPRCFTRLADVSSDMETILGVATELIDALGRDELTNDRRSKSIVSVARNRWANKWTNQSVSARFRPPAISALLLSSRKNRSDRNRTAYRQSLSTDELLD